MATEFNAIDYIKQRNEAEVGNSPAIEEKPKVEAAAEEEPAAEQEEEHVSRRQSRSYARTQRQIGELRGKLQAYEEIIKSGMMPAAKAATEKTSDDPEPLPENFTTDAEYFKAVGAHAARQEAKSTIKKELTTNEQNQAWSKHVAETDAQAVEDKELFDDWNKVCEAAKETGPEYIPEEHPVLMALIAQSDFKASIVYHFAKNPDAFESFLEMNKDQNGLIRKFHRLEGRLEDDIERRRSEKAKPKEEKKTLTAAERDAKKPLPSSAVSVKSGQTPSQVTSPYLEDGKTVNPAWLAERNAREQRR
jgi:hypothetical protein